MTLEELFAGRNYDIPAAMARLKAAAADCGLPFGDRTMTYNSRLAQEAGKWAESLDRGDAFHMAVFKAYFAEGRNIGKISVLIELTESLGLKGVEEVLSKGVFEEAVDNDWKYSRRSGITAVPTFSANGRTVVGAQPYNVLEDLVRVASRR